MRRERLFLTDMVDSAEASAHFVASCTGATTTRIYPLACERRADEASVRVDVLLLNDADASDEIFSSALGGIAGHFAARQLFTLPRSDAELPTGQVTEHD